jgi:hypothetical protein
MRVYVIFLAMIFLWNAAAQADDVLVVAHPKKVEFVMAEGDLPENQNTGNVYVGGVYKTTLAIQEVLHGALTQKSLVVNLVATSKENLSKAKSIVVLLVPDKDGTFRVGGWDTPRTIVCLPKRLAIEDGLQESLPLELEKPSERCQYVH